eukprot:TRINITY_DN22386_c0_g1_i1.p1 TRINITY_DN22386_c0_g1~~TRINITY_DN22386_c0_g1_i1.p1  ORF type:complete len:461 (+),score=180.32 TRINITY_DN22386_c0_g1_i1:69-1451(+)
MASDGYVPGHRREKKTLEELVDEQMGELEKKAEKLVKQRQRRADPCAQKARPELRSDGLEFYGDECEGEEIIETFPPDALSEVTDMSLCEATLDKSHCDFIAEYWIESGVLDDLETLDLSTAKIAPDGLARLLQAIATREKKIELDKLVLDGCTRADQAVMEAIVEVCHMSPSLREMHLSDLWLDDTDCLTLSQGLVNCRSMSTLVLNDNRVGPEGAVHLAEVLRGCFALRTVEVNHNRLVDEGVATLLNILDYAPHITSMGLGANGVHGFDNVNGNALKNCGLTSLSLRDNHLLVHGSIGLSKLLRGAASIRNLYLHNCRLGNDGACVILGALADSDNGIRCLDLSQNGIGHPQGAVDIIQYLCADTARVLKLDLSYNAGLGDDGLFVLDEGFKAVHALRFLILTGCAVKETASYDVETQQGHVLHVDISSDRDEDESSDDDGSTGGSAPGTDSEDEDP